MCAILISKVLRLARVNEGSHSFTCHLHVYPHMELAMSNTLSIRSAVVDEERMRPGSRLWSVFRVSFSALTLLAGWQAGHLALKNMYHLSSKTLFQDKWRHKNKW